MAHLRVRELREKKKEELLKQLNTFKQELSQLRVVKQVSGSATKLGQIGTVRKNIARILTVLNQNERDNLRKYYADKKWTPKNLRPKLTHRRRLALSPNEKNRKTRHQLRVAHKFPKRVYAVKI